jgi:hypothetical protein
LSIGVFAMRLPAGYLVVGGLSIFFALGMGSNAVRIGISVLAGQTPAPTTFVEWAMAAAFILPPLPLLVGGILLFAKTHRKLYVARVALLLSSAILLLTAALVIFTIVEDFKHSTRSDTAYGLAFAVCIAIAGPALIWALVVLATGIMLGRRLRQPS